MTNSAMPVLCRRATLRVLGCIAAGAAGLFVAGCAEPAIKWSTGTARPRSTVPANATDCHHHIYDSHYPVAPNAALRPPDALVSDYRALQGRLGTTRNVIVQPSTYGVDNRLLVESLTAFGTAHARGVAVVNTEVADTELRRLHDAGVRGIRFNLANPGTTTLDMVRPLAPRVADLGWHIQVNALADTVLDAEDIWANLPCPVVFDHLGRIPEPNAIAHPAFAMIRELVQRDKAWVKLSGFYIETKVGAPSYSDSVVVARTYAHEAPERMVWGSDWPHPTEKESNKPDDALLLDLLTECVSNDTDRAHILVDNPARLYQFS